MTLIGWHFRAGACALGLVACRSPAPLPRAEPLAPASVVTSGEAAVTSATPGASVAVLELFTSEGCSSCPAADETLARLTERAEQRGQPLITLELHVDYWNYLGWTDPFSAAVHTQRQRAYADHFGKTGVYTPQLVVAGREELVGSDEQGAESALQRAQLRPASARVSVRARRDGSSYIVIDYAVSAPGVTELQLALAQDHAETRVTRGENAERLLRHRHVVRAFESVRAPGSGSWRVPVAGSEAGERWFIAAYATDPSALSVLGAAAYTLESGR